MTNRDTNKKALIEALEKTMGIVTRACQLVDISRNTFYRYYNDDEAFKAKVDDIENIALDFAESKLHKMIGDENTAAVIFYLKTKGKKRGYIERNEVTGAEGSQINFVVALPSKDITSDEID
jgi:predicted site-specific integrase-resolvase